jgi:hypothetical protein
MLPDLVEGEHHALTPRELLPLLLPRPSTGAPNQPD